MIKKNLFAIRPSEKRRKSGFGECSQVPASTSLMMTEIALSEMTATTCQGASAGGVSVPLLGGTLLGRFELTPRKGLVAKKKLSQGSRYYTSHSTKTMSKISFDVNLPSVLNPSHITTSLSSNQKIQFARAVSLEVTWRLVRSVSGNKYCWFP